MPTFSTSPGGSPADAPDATPHAVLVGLSGAGKSTAGRLLAEKLARPFLDFDDEIERRAGLTIPAIFAERGEEHFREMERELTEDCANHSGMILAPGAGWITTPGLVNRLRPPARLIYLKVRPEAAARRMGEGRIVRPLLARGGNPATTLEKMLKEREPLYAKADASVNTEMYDMERLILRLESIVQG